jgi:carotenoid cleavage dioxygenase-like enzyme
LADRVPGIAFGWCTGFGGTVSICDNIGVMPYRLPDGKTFVYTTDISDWLLFNPDDLSTQGWLEWNIKDYGKNVPTGTTHIVDDVGSPNTIGLMCVFDAGITGTKTTMVFYKVQPDDIHNRIEIGSIPTGADMPYFHSFGHTEDYLIFPRNSVNFNLPGMAEGKPMIDNFIFDYDNNLDFYIMNKSDGSYKKYSADHGGVVMHSGNAYIDENNNLIYDAEMFARCETNPFVFFDLNWLRNPDRSTFKVNMRMRRYTINLDSGDVTYEDLIEKKEDTAGFIMINPKMQG